MAQMKTVNQQKVSSFSSKDVAEFVRGEMKVMHRVAANHIVTSTKMKNVSKVEETGNGHIRCA